MASRKVSEYASKTTPVDADYLPIVDPGETLPVNRNKRLTFANLRTWIVAQLAAVKVTIFRLGLATAEVTITTGTATLTRVHNTIDTEADAATDDLVNLAGLDDGEIAWISPASAARTVVIKAGTGNIRTWTGEDVTLTELHHCVPVRRVGSHYHVIAWLPTVVRNNNASTAAPGVTNDASEGYTVGSQWLDVTNDRGYLLLDATENAAVWKEVTAGQSAALNKLDATVAPVAGDDSADGYSVGSLWIDVTADLAYVCVDASEAAAVWQGISASGGLDAEGVEDVVGALVVGGTGITATYDDGVGSLTLALSDETFTAALETKLDGIAGGAEVNPDLMSEAEAETGTATTERVINAAVLKAAVLEHSPASSGLQADGSVDGTGRQKLEMLSFGVRNVKTIASGGVAVGGSSFLEIGSETGTTDVLLSMTGGGDGDIVILTAKANHTITVGTSAIPGGIRNDMPFEMGPLDVYPVVKTGNFWFPILAAPKAPVITTQAYIGSVQNLTTTYADAAGSSIAYAPRFASSSIAYSYNFTFGRIDGTGHTLHGKFFVYGAEQTNWRWTHRANTADGRVHYEAFYENDSLLSKTFKLQMRNQDDSVEGKLHQLDLFDNAASTQSSYALLTIIEIPN